MQKRDNDCLKCLLFLQNQIYDPIMLMFFKNNDESEQAKKLEMKTKMQI